MDAYRQTNRGLWDGWARLHKDSAFYDIAGFRAGASSLMPIEVDELGDVSGQSLLHLQCHLGLDTLSWARRGATVTGVDFSEEALATARTLATDLGIPATFVCTDLYALPDVLDARFDVVFTSYGVLPWLPDLGRWARLIAHFLKPGGVFYLAEFHPLLATLSDDGEAIAYPYFAPGEPLRFEAEGSYAEPDADFAHTAYEWPHSIGEVVTALVRAGLRLDFLHEYPYSPYLCWPFLEETAPGQYAWKGRPDFLPHVFTIKARR